MDLPKYSWFEPHVWSASLSELRSKRSVGYLAVVFSLGLSTANETALLLTSGVVLLIGFVSYRHQNRDQSLHVDRQCTSETAIQGERVRVRMTVRNLGGDPVNPTQLLGAVPPRLLSVIDADHGDVSLDPGEKLTLTYVRESDDRANQSKTCSDHTIYRESAVDPDSERSTDETSDRSSSTG